MLRTIKRRKAYWVRYILRRNCRLKHVFEGRKEGAERRGRRRKQLLVDFKETRRYGDFKGAVLYYIHSDRSGTVVQVLRYKSEGRWFDSRWCHWNFSLT